MATEDFPVLMAPSDSMLSLEVFDRKYLVEYPSREIWLSEAEAWLLSNGLKFYTDGSLFEGRAGCGVFSEELDLKASSALETFAIVFPDYCLRDCMTGTTTCIFSDSRAALLALNLQTVSSRLVLQCRNSMQRLCIHNGVQLFWVLWYNCTVKILSFNLKL
jgi:hypothetical protein